MTLAGRPFGHYQSLTDARYSGAAGGDAKRWRRKELLRCEEATVAHQVFSCHRQ